MCMAFPLPLCILPLSHISIIHNVTIPISGDIVDEFALNLFFHEQASVFVNYDD